MEKYVYIQVGDKNIAFPIRIEACYIAIDVDKACENLKFVIKEQLLLKMLRSGTKKKVELTVVLMYEDYDEKTEITISANKTFANESKLEKEIKLAIQRIAENICYNVVFMDDFILG